MANSSVAMLPTGYPTERSPPQDAIASGRDGSVNTSYKPANDSATRYESGCKRRERSPFFTDPNALAIFQAANNNTYDLSSLPSYLRPKPPSRAAQAQAQAREQPHPAYVNSGPLAATSSASLDARSMNHGLPHQSAAPAMGPVAPMVHQAETTHQIITLPPLAYEPSTAAPYPPEAQVAAPVPQLPLPMPYVSTAPAASMAPVPAAQQPPRMQYLPVGPVAAVAPTSHQPPPPMPYPPAALAATAAPAAQPPPAVLYPPAPPPLPAMPYPPTGPVAAPGVSTSGCSPLLIIPNPGAQPPIALTPATPPIQIHTLLPDPLPPAAHPPASPPLLVAPQLAGLGQTILLQPIAPAPAAPTPSPPPPQPPVPGSDGTPRAASCAPPSTVPQPQPAAPPAGAAAAASALESCLQPLRSSDPAHKELRVKAVLALAMSRAWDDCVKQHLAQPGSQEVQGQGNGAQEAGAGAAAPRPGPGGSWGPTRLQLVQFGWTVEELDAMYQGHFPPYPPGRMSYRTSAIMYEEVGKGIASRGLRPKPGGSGADLVLAPNTSWGADRADQMGRLWEALVPLEEAVRRSHAQEEAEREHAARRRAHRHQLLQPEGPGGECGGEAAAAAGGPSRGRMAMAPHLREMASRTRMYLRMCLRPLLTSKDPKPLPLADAVRGLREVANVNLDQATLAEAGASCMEALLAFWASDVAEVQRGEDGSVGLVAAPFYRNQPEANLGLHRPCGVGGSRPPPSGVRAPPQAQQPQQPQPQQVLQLQQQQPQFVSPQQPQQEAGPGRVRQAVVRQQPLGGCKRSFSTHAQQQQHPIAGSGSGAGCGGGGGGGCPGERRTSQPHALPGPPQRPAVPQQHGPRQGQRTQHQQRQHQQRHEAALTSGTLSAGSLQADFASKPLDSTGSLPLPPIFHDGPHLHLPSIFPDAAGRPQPLPIPLPQPGGSQAPHRRASDTAGRCSSTAFLVAPLSSGGGAAADSLSLAAASSGYLDSCVASSGSGGGGSCSRALSAAAGGSSCDRQEGAVSVSKRVQELPAHLRPKPVAGRASRPAQPPPQPQPQPQLTQRDSFGASSCSAPAPAVPPSLAAAATVAACPQGAGAGTSGAVPVSRAWQVAGDMPVRIDQWQLAEAGAMGADCLATCRAAGSDTCWQVTGYQGDQVWASRWGATREAAIQALRSMLLDWCRRLN